MTLNGPVALAIARLRGVPIVIVIRAGRRLRHQAFWRLSDSIRVRKK
jgi:hypothetical protein